MVAGEVAILKDEAGVTIENDKAKSGRGNAVELAIERSSQCSRRGGCRTRAWIMCRFVGIKRTYSRLNDDEEVLDGYF